MKRLTRTVVAFSLIFAAVSVGSAASQQGDDARSEHQRIVDFWTADKVRQAVPRDFVFDRASGRFIPTAPGGVPGRPGGGGGGGDTTVTGAHWTNGGVVLESTGKVLFSLGTDYYVCSASVVNDGGASGSLAVTAAHCAYENAAGSVKFAENWMYIPNYDQRDEQLSLFDTTLCKPEPGCWTATALVVHDGFASAGGFNGTAIQYDFAFAVLEGPEGSPDLDTYGEQGIAFDSISKGSSTYAFGYPHAATFNGDLRYCAGGVNFDNRFFKLTYKLKCDMTGGASGGPWLFPFNDGSGTGTVMSVNSYRYSSGDAMYGPKFNASTEATYNAAKTASESCVVAESICTP